MDIYLDASGDSCIISIYLTIIFTEGEVNSGRYIPRREAVKFPVALLENTKLALIKKIFVTVRFVYEMLFIQELKPSLNTQSDSISARLFV